MIYRFTMSYSGFAGAKQEQVLLVAMRKALQCGTGLVETGAGYDLRIGLRDINYELTTTNKIHREKIEKAVISAAEKVFDCAAVKIEFQPTLPSKAAEKAPKKTVKTSSKPAVKKATKTKKVARKAPK